MQSCINDYEFDIINVMKNIIMNKNIFNLTTPTTRV